MPVKAVRDGCVGTRVARTIFANGRYSTLYGRLPFFIIECGDTSFSGGNTFSLAWHPNSFLSNPGASAGSKQELELLSYKQKTKDLPDIAYLTLKTFQHYGGHFLAGDLLTKHARIQSP